MRRTFLAIVIFLFAAPALAQPWTGRGRPDHSAAYVASQGSETCWLRRDGTYEATPSESEVLRKVETQPVGKSWRLWKSPEGWLTHARRIRSSQPGQMESGRCPWSAAPKELPSTSTGPLTAEACWPIVRDELPATSTESGFFGGALRGAWTAARPFVSRCLSGCRGGLTSRSNFESAGAKDDGKDDGDGASCRDTLRQARDAMESVELVALHIAASSGGVGHHQEERVFERLAEALRVIESYFDN